MQGMRFSSLKFRYLLYTGSLLGCTLSKYHHIIILLESLSRRDYLSWYNLVSPPLSASACLHLCPPTSVNVCLPSATTPKHTCSVLTQLHCTYHQTNFGSRPNMSGPSSHAKGCHTYALFPICPICLIPLHWQ